MPNINNPSNLVILYTTTAITLTWLALIIWTIRDIQTRTRNNITKLAATITTAILPIPGILIYLLLRPKETLSEAYERSLEEEALLQEIEETQTCPGCGHNIEKTWQICSQCHTRLKKPCHNCRNLLETSWSICPFCTAPQNNYNQPNNTTKAEQTPTISIQYRQQPNLQFIDEEEL